MSIDDMLAKFIEAEMTGIVDLEMFCRVCTEQSQRIAMALFLLDAYVVMSRRGEWEVVR